MDTVIEVKNTIREFLRKYDEIVNPIIRFVCCLIIFLCINSLFGYSDLVSKFSVVFLLAVISALLPDGFLVFVSGLVIAMSCVACSMELGAAYLVVFVVMYCVYIRFFPEYSYAMFLTIFCCVIHMPYIAPIVLIVTAGMAGAIPGAFGMITYYFSLYVAKMNDLIAHNTTGEKVDVLSGFVSDFLKNKEMLLGIVIFVVVILAAGLIYRLSFNYSWYVAIGAGVVLSIITALFGGLVIKVDAPVVKVLIGSILGALIALLIQFCKDIIDYSRTEHVQYEDDDYYYYVKAVPKVKTREALKSEKLEIKRKEQEDAEE